MAFLDSLQKNLSSVGKQAAEKAKDVADITVKTTQLHTEKQKLEEIGLYKFPGVLAPGIFDYPNIK